MILATFFLPPAAAAPAPAAPSVQMLAPGWENLLLLLFKRQLPGWENTMAVKDGKAAKLRPKSA